MIDSQQCTEKIKQERPEHCALGPWGAPVLVISTSENSDLALHLVSERMQSYKLRAVLKIIQDPEYIKVGCTFVVNSFSPTTWGWIVLKALEKS